MRAVASGAADAHLRYLEREGVTGEGEKGLAYSAFENETDGRAFIERGREDRHQFRFIVAPENAAEMDDLRRFTRDLMRQMERDLDTRLDWIAVDHHNTGHPHTHIMVRGATDDGKILNIAGDYIAHGVRHRASELVTLELGHQSEIELARKLASEVDAERLTRLDRMLLAEQRDKGVVDLRPSEGSSYPIRENWHTLISRAKRLARYGLATEKEPGRWIVADKAEAILKQLGERNDIIKTMHRALADHGLADQRGADQYLLHGDRSGASIIGRVLGKGLAGDEMGERVYLIVDGVDGRVHHIEFAKPERLDDVRRGMIVESKPIVAEPRQRIATSQSSPRVMAASTDPAVISTSSGTVSSVRAKTRTPSSASMSAGSKPCAGPAMSDGSTPTTGASRMTSPRAACATTSAAAATDSPSASSRRSTSKRRSAATARPGSIAN